MTFFWDCIPALRMAAERGHIKAMNNLVLAYLNGDGVEQSDKQAVHWAEEMMKLESARGYYHMGTFLEQGIGVKHRAGASKFGHWLDAKQIKQIIRLPGGMLAFARKLSLLAVSSRNKLSASLRSTAYAARNVRGKVVGQVTNY